MVRAILAFAFLTGIILLQIFLSRTERKWPGLILPVISFLFGFLYPFNQKEGLIPRSLLRNKLFQDVKEVIY